MIFDNSRKNARAALIQTMIGLSPTLEIWTGPPPLLCSDPASGVLLATLFFSVTWLSSPVAGLVSQTGTCATGGGGAVATGLPGYFRIKDAGGVVRAQGKAGEDLTLAPIVAGTSVTLTSFSHLDT